MAAFLTSEGGDRCKITDRMFLFRAFYATALTKRIRSEHLQKVKRSGRDYGLKETAGVCVLRGVGERVSPAVALLDAFLLVFTVPRHRGGVAPGIHRVSQTSTLGMVWNVPLRCCHLQHTQDRDGG